MLYGCYLLKILKIVGIWLKRELRLFKRFSQRVYFTDTAVFTRNLVREIKIQNNVKYLKNCWDSLKMRH